ncbi:MAG: hypothetical protein ABFS35_13980 [Bacteroidota bacterium]
MTTVSVDDKYIETIKSFTDIQTAMDIALKRYVIELISTKLTELSKRNNTYINKYQLDFETFSDKIIHDENYVLQLEQDKEFINWEDDLIDWEFNYKGIKDWKGKLQNILTT